MTATNLHPEDYQHNVAIISQPQRLCTACGGYVQPDLHTNILACLTCHGLAWEWVQESESEEYRKTHFPAQMPHTVNDFTPKSEDKIPNPVWTSYTPSDKELNRRVYNGLHVDGHTCPSCKAVLTVNEKQDKTVDGIFFTRRLVCPNWFITGCRYTEKWTSEIRDLLNAEAMKLESADAEF